MEIVIKLTSEDLKDNLCIDTINNLFKSEKTIISNFDNLEDLIPPHQQKPLKSTENAQKKKDKTKEERITELKKYANSIWVSLNEKQKKSLKKFVEFYIDKIEKENFTINIEKQLKNWFERDKNLK